MLTKFDEQSQKAIVIAESLAFDFGHSNVGSEHLLLSLLKLQESKLKKLLQKYKVTDEVIEADIIRLFGQNDDQPFYLEYSEIMKRILEESIELSKMKNQNQVTLNILSMCLLQVKDSVALELLKKYNVDIEDMIYVLNEKTAYETRLDQINSLVNLNKKVKDKHYKIVGRDKEIDKICAILSKKEKNNVLIIGEAGVGKSAVVEKLAMLINAKKAPQGLEHKIIYELSLSSLVAGTKYRGEFEEKFKKIIDKIKELNNVIIFIDEIHNLIGAGGAEGAIDASNILKPYLARKDMTIIGATTLDEYYNHFEHDHAMNRRFSIVTLKENTKEETYQILSGIKKYYEDYHHIKISQNILNELIELVDEYLKNRTYPDKAIDILDLACVEASFHARKELTKEDIIKTIEQYLSIHINKKLDFNKLKNQLNHHIIGQKEGINKIVQQLQNKLFSSIMITGTTGIGKSETAKALAKYLNFHFIKLDMTQFKDTFSVSKIIGSPPGYVGYNQPSLLLTELQSYPHSVLLLDEIDKAHKDVLDLFLQVLDEGYLEDSKKRKIYFNNVIIIMTCHIKNHQYLGFKKVNHKYNTNIGDEFINRIDQVVEYKTLNKEDLKDILLKHHVSNDGVERILKDYPIQTGARNIIKKAYQLEKTN